MFDPSVVESAGLSSVTPAEMAARNAAIEEAIRPMVPVTMRYSSPASMPVGKPNPDTAAANKKADGAKGAALAEKLVKEIVKQEVSLVRYLRNIADLGQEGRTQFRKAMKDRIGELAELLALGGCSPEDKDSYQYKAIKAAHATATVRLSECKVFSEACDMGFEFGEDETYPSIISAARLFKKGLSADGDNNAVGPTRRRGRPATPTLDKLKKWLKDNVKPEEIKDVAEFMETWISLQNLDKA